MGRKTECSCGRGTGFWCGSCLNTRMGQNIDEVFRMPDWRCPSCLQICNCSGRTCDRHNAGLGCTRILSAEAREQGYKSVRPFTRFRPAVQLPVHTAVYPGMGNNDPLVDDFQTEGLLTCQFQNQINHQHSDTD